MPIKTKQPVKERIIIVATHKKAIFYKTNVTFRYMLVRKIRKTLDSLEIVQATTFP